MPISPIKANETSMLWLTVLKNMSGFKEAHLSGVFFFLIQNSTLRSGFIIDEGIFYDSVF